MIDKFLTDLAAHAGCYMAEVAVNSTFAEGHRFDVSLYWDDNLTVATGPTVNDAMNAAIAAKRAREAEEAA